ncbi:competence damage-inducible protein [Lasius niger]|uniref:Competence damage-inducible protein n=1 Tax=Lasius niger TaxID=67767 RepID=A0A0J7MWW4_LASNI|nr:competence damage-inducible protein [Lasius niger]
MSEKKGTAWIQELRKEQVIRELQERGIETEEAGTLEKLRHILREVVKKEQAEKVSVKEGIQRQRTFKIKAFTKNGIYNKFRFQNRTR